MRTLVDLQLSQEALGQIVLVEPHPTPVQLE
jgi:hypothetical protein